MKLDSSTKKAYKEGMYTLFETLGTEIEFCVRNTDEQNQDIYGDLIEENPTEVYVLVAMVENKALDNNNFDLRKQGRTDEITVTIPLLAIENNGLEPYSMDSGYFVYNGREYEIMAVVPKDVFAQMYTSFEFTCKGVSPL